jgi:sulfane dehydrogenase subunit SoxC
VADATRPEVMLAYAINGRPLPPQHGFPLRLVVPGWYGMTSVKWLRSITVVDRPFEGYQQATAYHHRVSSDDAGVPVTRMLPRALMVPPGVPDFMTRTRFVEPSVQVLEGRAWSGRAPLKKVEVSVDGGSTWSEAALEHAASPYAWRRWTFRWNAAGTGEHELCVRATDEAGSTQPDDAAWSTEGVQNNAVQRVRVTIGSGGAKQVPADSH